MSQQQNNILKELETEIEKNKGDLLKTQLFKVQLLEFLKKQTNPQSLPKQTIISNTPQIIPIINTDVIEIVKPIQKYISLNKINTKNIIFMMQNPTNWKYSYKMERLKVFPNDMSEFKLELASVPKEHLIDNDINIIVKLYVKDTMWKEVSVMFKPVKKSEYGQVVSCHVL